MSRSSSRIRDVSQKKAFGLPFAISGGYWHNFLIPESKERIFVICSVNTRQLPNIQVLLTKKDAKYGQCADLAVALKISDTDIGNILQAIIFMKLVKSEKWSVKDIEWVDIRKKILTYLAENLNRAEKSGIKRWHLNRDNIMLISPSRLTQHDIAATIKECMGKIANIQKGKTLPFFAQKAKNRYN